MLCDCSVRVTVALVSFLIDQNEAEEISPKEGAWQTFSCRRNETGETSPKQWRGRCLVSFSIRRNEAEDSRTK